ncbi:Lycopene cyclase [Hymenobacter sp. BT683]|uniref:Lycopene cyclase n=1 Tax=Hymenobacter jeongseonensis TaxID=2791027 RepID=A0ABS0ICC5_9BACT|nr:lycopene cyclase family protein [Hymenobacter jeongseonensis]MBF9235993.1 Lycopene cyclase [Hymenobacter jeongseonensis]
MPASDASLDYDYLIVGGGAAGLSLAYHMAQEPRLAAQKVLIIEPEAKDQNDRTWSYWSNTPMVFDGLAAHEWRQIAFRSPGFDKVIDLGTYRYRMIRGLDYYQFIRAALADNPQFTTARGTVEKLENLPHGVSVSSSAGEFTARYAFDSRPPDLAKLKRPENYRYLLQHFVGWEVETEVDAFNPEVVEFMDFRGEQHHEARFVYVLPFSPRKALVEYTLFSETPLAKSEYEAAIREYLTSLLGESSYRIVAEETGAIPMTDHPLPAKAGAHIINLGTRGGRAKASTGYAFKRIQQQSERLVAALASTGHPPADPTGDRWQFRLFDTLLLDIMQRRGETTRDIFRQLFARNPVERIFRFLDETTSWADNLRVMNSVAPEPFMRSIAQVLRGKPGRR